MLVWPDYSADMEKLENEGHGRTISLARVRTLAAALSYKLYDTHLLMSQTDLGRRSSVPRGLQCSTESEYTSYYPTPALWNLVYSILESGIFEPYEKRTGGLLLRVL